MNRSTLHLLLLFTALFITDRVLAAPEQKTRFAGVYEVVEDTAVYRGPSEDAEQIASITAGTRVNVFNDRGDWVAIYSQHGRPPGFIKKSSLVKSESTFSRKDETPNATADSEASLSEVQVLSAEADKSIRYYQLTKVTHVYRRPSEHSDLITILSPARKVYIVESPVDKWVKVQYKPGGPSGYIKTSNLVGFGEETTEKQVKDAEENDYGFFRKTIDECFEVKGPAVKTGIPTSLSFCEDPVGTKFYFVGTRGEQVALPGVFPHGEYAVWIDIIKLRPYGEVTVDGRTLMPIEKPIERHVQQNSNLLNGIAVLAVVVIIVIFANRRRPSDLPLPLTPSPPPPQPSPAPAPLEPSKFKIGGFVSIRDLKLAQEENLLLFRRLAEKLVIFNNEAMRQIFETVQDRTLLRSEQDVDPPIEFAQLVKKPYSYATEFFDFRGISARFHVVGTDILLVISNQSYRYGKVIDNQLLFAERISAFENSVSFKTNFDACALPFDLLGYRGHLDRMTYRFTWKGGEDNSKVVDAAVQWLDTKTFPRSDF